VSAEALRGALRRLAAGESLSSEETAGAFSAVMRGEGTSAQVAALLMALRVKGETAAEITGGAMALRDAMVTLPASSPEDLVDTAGTGGGKVATFNISTAAALVAAGAGARVAKHGNRSFTTRSGGADVLEALRVRIELSVDEMRRVLDEAGIVFMFAPLMHPAMRHVGPVRRELGVPTVMNVLGPLANPAGAGRQVVGVADAGRLSLLAEALAALGSVHALVVHGEPGMDEVSPLGITHVLEVRDGQVRPWTIDPAKFGLAAGSAAGLAGGMPSDNARIIEAVLSGKERGVARSAVILNAAAAIYVAGLAPDIFEAAKLAAGAIDSGAGAAALERLKSASAKR
jgi:anthranilate phosphoribosyltransferase